MEKENKESPTPFEKLGKNLQLAGGRSGGEPLSGTMRNSELTSINQALGPRNTIEPRLTEGMGYPMRDSH